MRTGQETRFWQQVRICDHGLTARLEEKARWYIHCRLCCWPWNGARDQAGYGRTRYVLRDREEHFVHRVAWAFAHGGSSMPEGYEVAHTCDNPPCCNPAHLWQATHRENHEDSVGKGRRSHGGARPRVLTWEMVRRMRQQRQDEGRTYRNLATEYGISFGMVAQIIRGESWNEGMLSPEVLGTAAVILPRR